MVKQRNTRLAAFAASAVALLVLAVPMSQARPAKHGAQVTLNVMFTSQLKPQWDIIIPRFEYTYPNINVNVTYGGNNPAYYALEITQLQSGSANDILGVAPGVGVPISVVDFAKAGYLKPLVNEQWIKAKRTIPIINSLNKVGQALYAFEPSVVPFGMWTNQDMLKSLGVTVPKTYSALLTLCTKLHGQGVTTVIEPLGDTNATGGLVKALAIPTVYSTGAQWDTLRKAGKVSFEGTPGWHYALEHFVQMNNAGCFEPGATGTSLASASSLFAQGQGLFYAVAGSKGAIDAGNPAFKYDYEPLPSSDTPTKGNVAQITIGLSLAINAHSSPAAQDAARTFIDFIARPYENDLYTQAGGTLSQADLATNTLPSYMSNAFKPIVQNKQYVVSETSRWPDANVGQLLNTNLVGLITGQTTIDGTLSAMDTLWNTNG